MKPVALRFAVALAALVVFLIVINDFTRPDPAAARRTRNGEACGSVANPVKVSPDDRVGPTPESDANLDASWDCALASYRNTSHDNDGKGYWCTDSSGDGGDVAGGRHVCPNTWSIAFIEFNAKGTLKEPEIQLEPLKSHLSVHSRNFVVFWVHGWRHGADRYDEDVGDFRKLLSYSKSFLNYRCGEDHTYCDTAVTGIYVAWPGNSAWFDPPCADRWYCGLIDFWVALTLPGRKSVSEQIAEPVVKIIREISATAKSADPEHSRVLVVGHSLGGNLLISNLGRRYVEQVRAHEPGRIEPSLLGDLVVLLNPAAEARKWTAIQDEFRKSVGVPRNAQPENADGADRFQKFFAPGQRPLVVALTSACQFPSWYLESYGKPDLIDPVSGKPRRILCDNATYCAFPMVKVLLFSGGRENRTTIGHLTPSLRPKNDLVGTTHEMEVDRRGVSSRYTTTFAAASQRDQSICEVTGGWLKKSRDRTACCGGSPRGNQWDSGYDETGKDCSKPLLWVNREQHLLAQIRHGIFRNADRNKTEPPLVTTTITGPNDPFWNVRVLENVISGHGGYVSYPTWCVINRLVLDDIIRASPEPWDRHRER